MARSLVLYPQAVLINRKTYAWYAIVPGLGRCPFLILYWGVDGGVGVAIGQEGVTSWFEVSGLGD